ncbi:MAG TPA: SMP-30/gluconolactonase/LRE family protein [Burkholderiaceae bacterium]
MTPHVIEPASPERALLGESPLWSAEEQCLYYVDIGAKQVRRLGGPTWQLQSQPGCIALIEGGGLLVATRLGLFKLDPQTGALQALAEPPYDPAAQRFNDGKPDANGRLWVGTIDDARQPMAALYRYEKGVFERMAEGITTSNGLSWSPDQRTLYWSDTKAHAIYAFDFDPATGAITGRRVFHAFAPRAAGQSLDDYGGRPDGATVDAEGCLWVAMYEGRRLLRFSPAGELLEEFRLPVRCPTMPAFGGTDMRTLFVTTACEGRPADELAQQPWAGQVLQLRVSTEGLAPHKARL